MTAKTPFMQQIDKAVGALRAGGVIAYPTEYCFGLGCDPRNHLAVERLLKIKQRKKEQGLILIAANLEQINAYADIDSLARSKEVKRSWPGPNTWLLPVEDSVSTWVRGTHSTLAMRLSAHVVCQALCDSFGHAIVSTSANRHGQDALLLADDVRDQFADELDYIVDLKVGGADHASTIRDATSGQQLR